MRDKSKRRAVLALLLVDLGRVVAMPRLLVGMGLIQLLQQETIEEEAEGTTSARDERSATSVCLSKGLGRCRHVLHRGSEDAAATYRINTSGTSNAFTGCDIFNARRLTVVIVAKLAFIPYLDAVPDGLIRLTSLQDGVVSGELLRHTVCSAVAVLAYIPLRYNL